MRDCAPQPVATLLGKGRENPRPTLYKSVVRLGQTTPTYLEPGIGFEPMTYALQKRCSTTELSRQVFWNIEDSSTVPNRPKSGSDWFVDAPQSGIAAYNCSLCSQVSREQSALWRGATPTYVFPFSFFSCSSSSKRRFCASSSSGACRRSSVNAARASATLPAIT